MSSEFGVEARAQASESVCMIDFDIELIGELCIHSFDHRAN
jgi:hypothetical protein